MTTTRGATDMYHTLPSGSSIDTETWNAMKAAGGWRGWLDARMYTEADQAHMDREIGRG